MLIIIALIVITVCIGLSIWDIIVSYKLKRLLDAKLPSYKDVSHAAAIETVGDIVGKYIYEDIDTNQLVIGEESISKMLEEIVNVF